MRVQGWLLYWTKTLYVVHVSDHTCTPLGGTVGQMSASNCVPMRGQLYTISLLMTASSVKSCTVTVPAQKLEVIRKIVNFCPLIKISGLTKTSTFAFVFSPVAHNMIKSKKNRAMLTTANTPVSVGSNNPFKQVFTTLSKAFFSARRHLLGLILGTTLLTSSHSKNRCSVGTCAALRGRVPGSLNLGKTPLSSEVTVIWA